MAHTASCANATTRSCRCGGCAGSLHGWTGALMLARPGMAEARAACHRAADQVWADATKPRRIRRPTRRMAQKLGRRREGRHHRLAGELHDRPFRRG